MKAGVITFHSANNYGAILQTWALQKVLKNRGIDVGVINYHPEIIDRLYDPMLCRRGVTRQLLRFRQFLLHRDSLKRYHRFIRFSNRNFNLIGDYRTYEELRDNIPELDAYIVGSDQVWNDSHTAGYDPAYFLEFAGKGRRVAYAASIGRDYFNPKYKDRYRKSLEAFDAISVRERSTVGAVSELVSTPVEVVLDPTLLLTREDYEEIKVKSRIKEKYILVYMIEKNDQLITFANRISIALGLPLIYRRPVPRVKNELPPFYTADAGEFIGLIEAAEYVITNSFHGTVFSTIYEKPFVSMLHSDTGSRTADLLKELGLVSHILYDIKEFKDFGMFAIKDKEALRDRHDELKEKSLAFLCKAIGI